MSFFDLRILITSLVSLNSSQAMRPKHGNRRMLPMPDEY
jgi:hypothetical protein